MSLFLGLYGISLGRYSQKSLAKSGGFGKKDKKGDGHIKAAVYRRGIQTFCTLRYCAIIKRFRENS